jgi:sialic acid synthase SpsE
MIIIGDPGSTHGGTLEGAKDCIDVAKEAGVDIVKFQLFYGNRNGNIELPRRHWPEIVNYARDKGIDIFASVFDEEAIYMLKESGIKKAKLAYSQNFNLRLIKTLKEEGFEIWASGDEDNYPNYADRKFFCIPEYPIKKHWTFRDKLDKENQVFYDGISFHKIWPFIIPDVMEYLEIHFHGSKKVDCPDYWFALSPKELRELCKKTKL